jgi:hypothetical protein
MLKLLTRVLSNVKPHNPSLFAINISESSNKSPTLESLKLIKIINEFAAIRPIFYSQCSYLISYFHTITFLCLNY